MHSIHRLWDTVGIFAFSCIATVAVAQLWHLIDRRFGKRRAFITDQWGNREPTLEEKDRLWWPAKYYAIAAGIGAAIGVVLWLLSFLDR
jgi:hypothetical protein